MKRSVIVFCIVLCSLFLISCGGRIQAGDTPSDTLAALNLVRTGTQGVELSVVPNYPPPLLYDQNELIALVELKNKGNYDLEAQDCFIQVTGFDPNIIKGGFGTVRSCAENVQVFEGKNVYNVQGGFNQLEFSSSNVVLPDNVYEYSPQLNFLTCYNYHTTASPMVCVDPILYQVTPEQKACQSTDVSAGGGQGGPVGVSHVGVDMVGSKAIFEINIHNYGSGRVLSPAADIRNCAQAGIDYRDLDKVEYYVELSGGSLSDCKPNDGIVRLNQGSGKIVCTFDIPSGTAFETPLSVNLDYSYVQNFLKEVKIIKTPQ